MASQARVQSLFSQEPEEVTAKVPTHEEITIPTNIEEEQPSSLPRTIHGPSQLSANLDLQSLLLAVINCSFLLSYSYYSFPFNFFFYL